MSKSLTMNRREFLGGTAGLVTATALSSAGISSALAAAPMVGTQVSQNYRRKLGSYEITVLGDGYVDLPNEIWSNPGADKLNEYLNNAYQPPGSIRNGVNAYLINTGNKLILIDSGAAGLFGPNAGLFPGNLSDVGVKPEDIDQILITHVHPDHIAGLLTSEGGVAIPNGQIHVEGLELDYWTSTEAQSKAVDISKPWFDLARGWQKAYDGRISTFNGETDLGDGITAFPLPGHSPGHTGFRVESEGESLLIIGDAVISAAIQFANPEAGAIWDTSAEDSIKSRKMLFDMAAADRTAITATHIPFPSFGYVDRRTDGTYAYVPEEWRYGL